MSNRSRQFTIEIREFAFIWAALLLLVAISVGCGSGEKSISEQDEKNQNPKAAQPQSNQNLSSNADDSEALPDSKIKIDDDQASDPPAIRPKDKNEVNKNEDPNQGLAPPAQFTPPDLVSVDDDRIQSCGIQKLEGKHITLYTDVRDSKEIKSYPDVFDQAVRQWCQYFSVSEEKPSDWKMQVFVIADKDAFRKAGLLNDQLPRFATGYQHGNQIWIYVQEDSYYTRHLLVHEGTHGFMQKFLGGYGPPWYAEGMAEMLAVHRWKENQLKLRYPVRNAKDTEGWGRVRIIRDAYKNEKALTLEEAMSFGGQDFFHASRPYAWSWAACYFLSQHPISRKAFAEHQSQVRRDANDFTQTLVKQIPDWKSLEKEWQLFVDEMDYGFDVEAASIRDVKTVVDSVNNKRLAVIDSEKGWHRLDFDVEPGVVYTIRTTGEFQIAEREHGGKREKWLSEPNGVSIEYHRGRPLGIVVVGVDAVDDKGKSELLNVVSAHDRRYVPRVAGKLCVRINDSPARLHDNMGTVQFEILRHGPSKERPSK